MFDRLFPPPVVYVAGKADDLAATLLPDEAKSLGWAAEKRVREFTQGRHCARKALRRLGAEVRPILRGSHREPIWPNDVVGSITHCDGFCAAAVAWRTDIASIGLDAEPDRALPPGLEQYIATVKEAAWLDGASHDVNWHTLLFSAKESTYKAWFPLFERWLGFEDISVAFQLGTRRFHPRIAPAPGLDREMPNFQGRYQIADGILTTAVVVLK